MKTAISIPDDVYAAAEALSRRLGKERDELYAEALRDYLARHDTAAITTELDRVYDAADPNEEAWAQAAARRVLERVDW